MRVLGEVNVTRCSKLNYEIAAAKAAAAAAAATVAVAAAAAAAIAAAGCLTHCYLRWNGAIYIYTYAKSRISSSAWPSHAFFILVYCDRARCII